MSATEPADRDGMFTDARLLEGLGSVVTCTYCGCVVADTDAHRQMHASQGPIAAARAFNQAWEDLNG